MTRLTNNEASVSSKGFSRRLLSAAAQYAKFSLGAVLLALLCMSSYAAVHQSDVARASVRDWLLPLSLVVNILTGVCATWATQQVRRLARLQRESEKRDAASWPGMLQH